MANDTYPPQIEAMIEKAGTLTADQVDALGSLWEEDEALEVPAASLALDVVGEVQYPVPTNQALVDAWERALDAAGTAGRVDEIEAARAAGRAVKRDARHLKDSASSKNGAEEAVRSAVLGVGMRDLIPDEDYRTLVGPWERVLGSI